MGELVGGLEDTPRHLPAMTREGIGGPQGIHHGASNAVLSKGREQDVPLVVVAIKGLKKPNRTKRGKVLRTKLTARRQAFCNTAG